METRLKQRLTGAAILVALVVMLVPEMFHGQRGDIPATTSSSGEGPPVRSYTIDLSDLSGSPARTAPLQSTPVNAGSAASDARPASAPQAGPTSVPGSSPAADASAAARTAPSAAPTPAPIAASATAVPRAQPPSVSASARQAPSGTRSGGGGGWAVQLGLFAKHDNAERLVHSAQAKGFAVSVSAADAKGLYRVYAGGMADRSAAEAYSQRLKDQGLPAAVIASP
jgi:cell division septation protein DedD